MRNSSELVVYASAKTVSGSTASNKPCTDANRKLPEPADAAASVAAVAKRPAPANSVGRYSATLTEKASAKASSVERASSGAVTVNQARNGVAPSVAATDW